MNIKTCIVSVGLFFSGLSSVFAVGNAKKYEELSAKYDDSYEAGDYSASVTFLEQAMVYIHPDSLLWFSDTYNGLAYAYWRLGKFEKAIDYGQKALDCDYQIGDSARISLSLAVLASIFTHQRRFVDAEHYMRDAVKFVPAGNSLMLARRYSTLGEILSAQKKNDEAISCIQRAYRLDSIDNRSNQVAIRLSQLGTAYMQNGDYRNADVVLAQASEKLRALDNKSSLCINLISQTRNYIHLGRNAEAEKTAAECLQLSEQIGQRKNKLDALRNLAMLRNSPQLYEQTLKLSDSLYNEQISQQIADFEVRYATAEKEREIALQQVTIERQQNALVVLAVVLSAIFLALVLVFIIRRMRRDIEHTEKMARELFVDSPQTSPIEKPAAEPKQAPTPAAANNQATSQPATTMPINTPAAAPQTVEAEPTEKAEPVQPAVQLSPREIEIVNACCRGKLSKEIADEFGISKKTVDNHKSAIYQKLGVCNNTELILYAVKHGIAKL